MITDAEFNKICEAEFYKTDLVPSPHYEHYTISWGPNGWYRDSLNTAGPSLVGSLREYEVAAINERYLRCELLARISPRYHLVYRENKLDVFNDDNIVIAHGEPREALLAAVRRCSDLAAQRSEGGKGTDD